MWLGAYKYLTFYFEKCLKHYHFLAIVVLLDAIYLRCKVYFICALGDRQT